MLTKQELQMAMPTKVRKGISQLVVDEVNAVLDGDVDTQERFRENLLSYTSVLRDGRNSLAQYMSAVKFVTFRLQENSILESWAKVFPDRYQRKLAEGASDKAIQTHASAYNRSKLVVGILTQCLVPVHIVNADLFQRALNTQVEIMTDPDISPKVRSDAADSVMKNTKAPETAKIELEVSAHSDGVIADLNRTMNSLAEQQKMFLEQGLGNTEQLAKSKLVSGEVIE